MKMGMKAGAEDAPLSCLFFGLLRRSDPVTLRDQGSACATVGRASPLSLPGARVLLPGLFLGAFMPTRRFRCEGMASSA